MRPVRVNQATTHEKGDGETVERESETGRGRGGEIEQGDDEIGSGETDEEEVDEETMYGW